LLYTVKRPGWISIRAKIVDPVDPRTTFLSGNIVLTLSLILNLILPTIYPENQMELTLNNTDVEAHKLYA